MLKRACCCSRNESVAVNLGGKPFLFDLGVSNRSLAYSTAIHDMSCGSYAVQPALPVILKLADSAACLPHQERVLSQSQHWHQLEGLFLPSICCLYAYSLHQHMLCTCTTQVEPHTTLLTCRSTLIKSDRNSTILYKSKLHLLSSMPFWIYLTCT